MKSQKATTAIRAIDAVRLDPRVSAAQVILAEAEAQVAMEVSVGLVGWAKRAKQYAAGKRPLSPKTKPTASASSANSSSICPRARTQSRRVLKIAIRTPRRVNRF